ncbi:MAG: hypothetical protein GY910_03005 [bacterium]|nr:hypothetical protein [Deltaproteobacteria bacterium]MCP4903924.1 hypothetical protein [bacterium]
MRIDPRPKIARGTRPPSDSRGIVLAIVLVLIFTLITAVYAFQRRAIIDATISRNRLDAAEADGLAKGGLRIAEALVAIAHAKHLATAAGEGETEAPTSTSLSSGANSIDALWQGIEDFPIELEGDRRLHIEIEDEGAKLNLNALVPTEFGAASVGDGGEIPTDELTDEDGSSADEEAVEYLAEVLEYIVDGMENPDEDRRYDTLRIAENLLDFIDEDSIAISGRNEDDYYSRQDPPYSAWNRPLVSIDQIGLVEDIDPALLAELRHYMTVHPIAGRAGINLNRAKPWVLKLVYSGTSGNRRLIDDRLVEDLYDLREKNKLVCDDSSANRHCISRSEVGNGELGNGSIYPEAVLPAQPLVFRVVATAEVGDIVRRIEAIYDTRPNSEPQLLSWRRLRGID